MATSAWALTGNAGTNPAQDAVGTTDNEPLVIKTNGVERVRVDANGNVGVGVGAPTSKLHVGGDLTVAPNPGTANSRVQLGSSQIGDSFDPKVGSALVFTTARYVGEVGGGRFGGVPIYEFAEKVRIDSVGQVGIRTAGDSAVATLDVRGQASFIGPLAINNATAKPGVGQPATDPRAAITFGSTDSSAAYYIGAYTSDIRANTILGVYSYQEGAWMQTWSPAGTAMQASKETGRILTMLGLTGLPGAPVADFGFFNATQAVGSPFQFGVEAAPGVDLVLGAGGSEQMRIQTNGNVGIGTNAPSTNLHVVGDITVSGDVLLTGADCAEDFNIAGLRIPNPGTVVVIDEAGGLRESQDAYDSKVAGVISGGGDYKHGLVLDKRTSNEPRVPLALVGKVYCKVDAQYSPIAVGDLLTTSPTPGHAMKATDPLKSFGCILGKALTALPSGQELIPILVTLQ